MLSAEIQSMFTHYVSGGQDSKKQYLKGERDKKWQQDTKLYYNEESYNEMGFFRDELLYIDVDDRDTGTLLLKLLLSNGVRTNVLKTSRGYHFYFKKPLFTKYSADLSESSSYMLDIIKGQFYSTSHFLLEYIPSENNTYFEQLILNGVEREFIGEHYSYNDLDELPLWLYPTNITLKNVDKIENFPPSPLGLADGRNNEFGKHWVMLLCHRSQLDSADDVEEVMDFINDNLFETPQFEELWSTLFTDNKMKYYQSLIDNRSSDMFKKKSDQTKLHLSNYTDERNKVDWKGLIRDFKNVTHMKRVITTKENKIYTYTGKHYESRNVLFDVNQFTDCMSNSADIIKKEVLADTTIPVIEPSKSFWISFPNCDYNILTREIAEHSPLHESTVMIDTELPIMLDEDGKMCLYEPPANELDKFYKDISCGDDNMCNFLDEMVGYVLYPTNDGEKIFILLGEGANGKTTLIEAVQGMLGRVNTMTRPINKVSQQFGTDGLDMKMLCSSGETSRNMIDGDIIKTLCSTDDVEIEGKHEKQYTARIRAKMWFASNYKPIIKDNTYGMFRRLEMVPFNMILTEESRDVGVKTKLRNSKECHQRMLWRALKGLNRLMSNDLKFTRFDRLDKENEKFADESDVVVSFLMYVYEELNLDVERINANRLYTEYFKNWAFENSQGLKLSKSTFINRMNSIGFENTRTRNGYRNDGEQDRCYMLNNNKCRSKGLTRSRLHFHNSKKDTESKMWYDETENAFEEFAKMREDIA